MLRLRRNKLLVLLLFLTSYFVATILITVVFSMKQPDNNVPDRGKAVDLDGERRDILFNATLDQGPLVEEDDDIIEEYPVSFVNFPNDSPGLSSSIRCCPMMDKLLNFTENYYPEFVEKEKKKSKSKKVSSLEGIDLGKYDILIVGAGLSGSVLAELHASVLNQRVLVLEKKEHLAGNCFDYIDENGIRVSAFGAHVFHSNNDKVWNYVRKFGEWVRYDHRVVGSVRGTYVPIPVNMATVNTLLDEDLLTVEEMRQWLADRRIPHPNPTNGEQAAKALVGDELYDLIYKHYTKKKWGKWPKELEPSVLQRIPVRDNWDDRYFDDKYQALPKNGYTKLVEEMISSEKIDVFLGVDFLAHKQELLQAFSGKKVFYTGGIDAFYDYSHGKLEYRALDFLKVNLDQFSMFPSPVVHFPSYRYPFTRVTEYKQFPNQDLENEVPRTTVVFEFAKDGIGEEGEEPFFPVSTKKNKNRYLKYLNLSTGTSTSGASIHFVGRLATFQNYDMDKAILSAMNYFEKLYGVYDLDNLIPTLYNHGDNHDDSNSDSEDKSLNLPSGRKGYAKIQQMRSNLPTMSVIVCHCKDSVNWVEDFFKFFRYKWNIKFFFYEKCGHEEEMKNYFEALEKRIHGKSYMSFEINTFPNRGREGQVYLHFLLHRLADIGDVNVFLQGEKETNCLHRIEHILMESLNEDPEKLYNRNMRMEKNHFMWLDYFGGWYDWIPMSVKRSHLSPIVPEICDKFRRLSGKKKEQHGSTGFFGSTRDFSDTCKLENLDQFVASYRGEFYASRSLVYHVVSRFRTIVNELYCDISEHPDFDKSSIFSGWNMEQMWWTLFKGLLSFGTTPRDDQIFNLCACAPRDFVSENPKRYFRFTREGNSKCDEVMQFNNLNSKD